MSAKYLTAFHGFMGVGEDFAPFADACDLDFETPDLIGHGSFQCDDPTHYSLDAQLEYWFDRGYQKEVCSSAIRWAVVWRCSLLVAILII